VGEAAADRKIMDHAVSDLTRISGRSRSCVCTQAGCDFRAREGFRSVGSRRRERMYEFLIAVSVAIPRIRDFRGLNPRLPTW
jgi:large subunit ribosomal protein L5